MNIPQTKLIGITLLLINLLNPMNSTAGKIFLPELQLELRLIDGVLTFVPYSTETEEHSSTSVDIEVNSILSLFNLENHNHRLVIIEEKNQRVIYLKYYCDYQNALLSREVSILMQGSQDDLSLQVLESYNQISEKRRNTENSAHNISVSHILPFSMREFKQILQLLSTGMSTRETSELLGAENQPEHYSQVCPPDSQYSALPHYTSTVNIDNEQSTSDNDPCARIISNDDQSTVIIQLEPNYNGDDSITPNDQPSPTNQLICQLFTYHNLNSGLNLSRPSSDIHELNIENQTNMISFQQLQSEVETERLPPVGAEANNHDAIARIEANQKLSSRHQTQGNFLLQQSRGVSQHAGQHHGLQSTSSTAIPIKKPNTPQANSNLTAVFINIRNQLKDKKSIEEDVARKVQENLKQLTLSRYCTVEPSIQGAEDEVDEENEPEELDDVNNIDYHTLQNQLADIKVTINVQSNQLMSQIKDVRSKLRDHRMSTQIDLDGIQQDLSLYNKKLSNKNTELIASLSRLTLGNDETTSSYTAEKNKLHWKQNHNNDDDDHEDHRTVTTNHCSNKYLYSSGM